MRILFLSQEYPPETGWGGIGSFVKVAGAALAERGHEVHVLSCVPGQPPSDRMDGGVHVHRRPQVRAWLPGRKRRLSITAQRLDAAASCKLYQAELGDRPFDVVESPDWMAEGLRFPRARAKLLVAHLHSPSPVIARFENAGRDYRLAGRLERRFVGRAGLVTSPSSAMVRVLRRNGWLAGDADVAIVPQPVEPRWSGLASVSGTDPVVLYVGRLERRKAPDVLVRAMAIVAGDMPDARCVLVGGSSGSEGGRPYAEFVARLADELRAPCSFVGRLDTDGLRSEMASARVVAMPSRFESFGLAGAEGMAAGRPVVTTDACGLGEVMTPGSGAVVPADDPDSLARALRTYLGDPGAAAAAGAEAARAMVDRCAPARIAGERENLYEASLHGPADVLS